MPKGGRLAGFVTQCSIDPPNFLICVSKVNHTLAVAEHSPGMGLHLLGEDQVDLARLFGEETGDVVDKFASVDWRLGSTGAPLLVDAGSEHGGPGPRSLLGRRSRGVPHSSGPRGRRRAARVTHLPGRATAQSWPPRLTSRHRRGIDRRERDGRLAGHRPARCGPGASGGSTHRGGGESAVPIQACDSQKSRKRGRGRPPVRRATSTWRRARDHAPYPGDHAGQALRLRLLEEQTPVP